MFVTSCTDILDKTDLSKVSEDYVWSDPILCTAYLNRLYTYLPAWSVTESEPTDEATGGGSWVDGTLTPDNVNSTATMRTNAWKYDYIRQANEFINTIIDESITTIDKELADRLHYEARFIRASLYFELVKRYGGVPLLTEVQGINDDLFAKRNSTKQCFDFIIAELLACGENLPESYSADNLGRVTRGAARALLGRVYLFRASPQFNPTNSLEHWNTAYNYNKQAMEYLSGMGYGLKTDGSYGDIFLNEMNKEVVFAVRYEYPTLTHNTDAAVRPIKWSQNATGGNHPIQKVIDMWPTADGKRFTIADIQAGQDIRDLWKNRDNRFYDVIVYQESLYFGEAMQLNQNADNDYAYGKSTGSRTGYYSKKAIDQNYSVQEARYSGRDFNDIRFAEVMLNYAEAAVETDKLDEAFEMLRRIRDRAGIAKTVAGDTELAGKEYGLDPNMSQEDMRQSVRDERYIELIFEQKRLWDLRRWRIFHQVMNGAGKRNALVLTRLADDNYSWYLYDRDNVTMKGDERIYFLPLSQTEDMAKNPNLEQTKDWGGAFDPLEGM